MNRRILATILSGFIAGVAVSAKAGNSIFMIIFILLFSVILRSFLKNRKSFYIGACVAMAFVIGSTWFAASRIQCDKFDNQFTDNKVKIYGIVDEIPSNSKAYYKITLKLQNILLEEKNYKINGKIIVLIKGTYSASLGDRLAISGTILKASSSSTNGSDYNIRSRMKEMRGSMFVSPSDVYKSGNTNSLYNKIRLFGETIKAKIGEFVPGDAGIVLKGITLGDTSQFSEELKSSFAKSGISHIAAVSGMNVTILIAFIMFITGKARGKRKLRGILSIIGVIIFMIMTGFSPSVMRAGIMGIIMLLAIIIDKKEDFFTSFFISAAVILLINPYSIYNISFLLSFASTAGIIIFAKPFSRILVKIMPKFLADIIATTAAAIISTTPIIVIIFNTFSTIAILTNILVLPYMEVIFIGSFILIMLGSIFSPLGYGLGHILSYLTNIIIYISNAFSALPFASLIVATPKSIDLLCYGLLIIILYMLLYKKKISKIFITVISLCIVINIIYTIYLNEIYTVEFINVGQGDCALISAPHNRNYLIDTGNEGVNTLAYLKSKGVSTIETIFLSHTDNDHSGSLEYYINNLNVKKVVMPFIKFYNSKDIYYKNLLISKGIDIEYADQLSAYDLGGGTADIIWPGDNSITNDRDNNNSLVIRLDYKGHSFLFTGDTENEAEKLILESDENIDADVLKISHHGSKNSASEEFLEEVTPAYAILSVGQNNYGHPSPDVISRLEDLECNIYRTDQHGNIVFTINSNGNMSISTLK